MSSPVTEPPAPAPSDAGGVGRRYRSRARFELIFASIWLAVGLFAVPATIFAVGGALLGPYGDNSRLGRFYGDFFADLAEPSVRAWTIALTPLVLISLLRLTFAGTGRGPAEPPASPERPAAPRRASEEARRVEPSISTD